MQSGAPGFSCPPPSYAEFCSSASADTYAPSAHYPATWRHEPYAVHLPHPSIFPGSVSGDDVQELHGYRGPSRPICYGPQDATLGAPHHVVVGDFHQGQAARPDVLQQGVQRPTQATGPPPHRQSFSSPEESGRSRSFDPHHAGEPHPTLSSGSSGPATTSISSPPSMVISQSVGRNPQTHQGEFHPHLSGGDHHRLVCGDQVQQNRPFQSVAIHRADGAVHSGDLHSSSTFVAKGPSDTIDNDAHRTPTEESGRLQRSQLQGRRRRRRHTKSASRPQLGAHVVSHCETRPSVGPAADHVPLPTRPDCVGPFPRYTDTHKVPLMSPFTYGTTAFHSKSWHPPLKLSWTPTPSPASKVALLFPKQCHNSIDRIINGWFKPPELHQSRSTPMLPLKPKKVGLLSMGVIRKFATPELCARLDKILEYVLSDQHYANVPTTDKDWMSDVSPEDLKILEDADIIEAIDAKGVKHVGRLFFVDEPHKGRRRPIFWPRELNDYTNPPTPPLRDIVDAALDILPNSWAVCFDLVSSFFQVKYAHHVKGHFAIKTPHGCYAFKRMVMGARSSPECMEVITQILAHEAVARAGTAATIQIRTHIDNVRFLGANKSHVESTARAFLTICKEASVAINDEPLVNQAHQHGEFLGMTFDYQKGTVCMSQKSLTKLDTREAFIDDQQSTFAEILSLFGSCVFASRVLRIPLAGYYNILKFIRRRGSSFSTGELKLEDAAEVWPSVQRLWHDLVRRLRKNAPVRHGGSSPSLEPIILVTDASVTGFGGALFFRGRVETYSGRWPTTRRCDDINALEMSAVEKCASHFQGILAQIYEAESANPPSLVVLVDNSSTMHVLRKGHAREFEFNEATEKALSALSGNGDVFCGWISTLQNPVDCLSRGDAAPPNLRSALGALGRRLPPLRRACVRPAGVAARE